MNAALRSLELAIAHGDTAEVRQLLDERPALLNIHFAENIGLTPLMWAASADGDLAHYEVRGCPGDDYNGDDESILATIMPTGARSFETDFALGTVGAVAGFKVYVVLTTGNERGSEAVYVSHLV